MKKLVIVLVAICMCFGLMACSSKEVEPLLKEKVEDVISGITSLAKNEEYINMIGARNEVLDNIAECRDAKIDKSKNYYVVDISEEKIKNFLAINGYSEMLEGESEDVKQYTYSMMAGSITNIVNSKKGDMILAASSIIAYGKTYVFNEKINNQLWIIPTDKNVCYAVTFIKSEEHVLSVNAKYMFISQEDIYEDPDLKQFDIEEKSW